MDLIRISHYLAWNYWNTIWFTSKDFIWVVSKYYNPPKSRDYFDFTFQSSWNDEVFFFSCLKELQKTWWDEILSNCINEFKIPPEFQDLSNLILTKKEKFEDEKEKLRNLKEELEQIDWWKKEATKFHETVKEIFDIIFTPNLVNWKKEFEIFDKTKRIDILYENKAVFWFFNWLNYIKKVNCPFIPVECKNYSKDVSNPEIDQITWRLWDKIWNFWILVCNTIDDYSKVLNKLKHNVNNPSWWISDIVIWLEIKDVVKLIEFKLFDDEEWINNLLMEKFNEITIK